MPKTIIWASDGSDNAARALPHATALLDGEGSMLIAVHVAQEHSTQNPDNAPAERHGPGLVEEVRSVVSDVTESGIRAVLRVVNFPGMQPAQAIADLASEVGIRAVLRVVNFPGMQPAQAIADLASEVGADMIVVGTRGHSPTVGVFAGSVAQRLLQVAPCPVLAVPPGAAAPDPRSGSAAATVASAAASAAEL
jgi:nucleotide-binding universal stress UspA family protein